MTRSMSKLVPYAVSIGAVGLTALLFWPVYDKIQDATAASILLLLVLVVVTRYGTGPGIAASIVAAIYLNFFFVPPQFTLRIVKGEDLVAIVTFSVVSIVVGQISSRSQRRAAQIQRLYDRLREAFEKSSHVEAIKQSEELKSALLNAVTHDLRTPLTSIKAAATTLRAASQNRTLPAAVGTETEADLLSVIVDQADRLNHFIDGMLELAKVQSGSFGNTASTDSVEEIIGAVLARADRLVAGHEVKVVCEDDLQVSSVNPKAIAQALFSLIENAARHGPPGSAITVLASAAEQGKVRIAVEDEGPGIPPEYRERVFEKFFQLSPPAPGATGTGLGLGLAIASGIIKAHGGQIWIEDRAGGRPGSRVVFTLRRSSPQAGPPPLLVMNEVD